MTTRTPKNTTMPLPGTAVAPVAIGHVASIGSGYASFGWNLDAFTIPEGVEGI